MSYCSCSNVSKAFAACAARSQICDGPVQNKETATTASTDSTDVKPIRPALPASMSKEELNGMLSKFNFLDIFDSSETKGIHITFFEEDLDCRLEGMGSGAKAYWLWQLGQCAPLYAQELFVNQYYFMDEHVLHFMCRDPQCRVCQYSDLSVESPECQATTTGQSYKTGRLDPNGWEVSNQSKSLIANLFLVNIDCDSQPKYVKPQLVSSHVNLGIGEDNLCRAVNFNSFTSLTVEGDRRIVEASWDCSASCKECKFKVVNAAVDDCAKQQGLGITFTEASQVSPLLVVRNNQARKVVLAICVTLGVLGVLTSSTLIWMNRSRLAETMTSAASWAVRKSCLSGVRLGNRFAAWPAGERTDDLIQSSMLILNGVMSAIFALIWDGENNPLILIRHRFAVSAHIIDAAKLDAVVAKLIAWIFALSTFTATLATVTLVAWCVTTSGARNSWRKARLLTAMAMMPGIFVVVAHFVFSTDFGQLVLLMKDQGFLVTDNDSLYKMATVAINLGLGGLSLNVMCFTLVFLFHGVGCGLYCGLIIFRIVFIRSSKIEHLNAPLLILTIVQPFICLHPVIIWSLDAESKLTFLLLNLCVWVLPFATHLIVKFIYFVITPRHGESAPGNMVVEILHLLTFLSAFLHATYFIITFEFTLSRNNLQPFFCCTIATVFTLMTSTSYLLLSLSNSDHEHPDEYLPVNRHTLDILPTVADEELAVEEVPEEEEERIDAVARPAPEAPVHGARAEAASEQRPLLWIWLFLSESVEYADPQAFGWRVGYRRIFLLVGSSLFSYVTKQTFEAAQAFSSKEEIHKLMPFLGTNLTWPDSESALDDVFDLYKRMKILDSYFMIGSCVLFWISLILDLTSRDLMAHRRRVFACSRVTGFLGSLTVFAGIVAVGIPDYLKATHLEDILPFCGEGFNAAVIQVGELCIGLFLACLFTYKLLPILAMIVPALVRASMSVLGHPSLKDEAEAESGKLRKTILRMVVMISSIMTVPITFVGMVIVQQLQNDPNVNWIIVAFWTVPPFVLFLGLLCDGRFPGKGMLMLTYCMYSISYLAAIASFLLYSFALEKLMNFVFDVILEPTVFIGFLAKIFLSNVVISDLLYTTVF